MSEHASDLAGWGSRSRPYPSAACVWLRECYGFRVDSPAGRIGFIEELLGEHDAELPSVLLVRSGALGRRLLPIAADQVADIVPRERRVILAGTPRLAAPDLVEGLEIFTTAIGLGDGLSNLRPRNEFSCVDCGYGAIAAYEPPRCPLCGGTRWRPVEGGASGSRVQQA